MEVFNQPAESLLDQYNTHADKFTVLDNGQKIYHPWYLTGGGDWYYPSFVDSINRAGKSQYNVAFEWCFGHGRIGWEILTRNLCKQLVFNDCYHLSISTGLSNADQLGYKDFVRGYHTATISAIPSWEKFDLVIGNPPHTLKKSHIYETCADQTQEMKDLACRIQVDQDWEIHRDFFKHVGNYLTDDADIFINDISFMNKTTTEMASEYGFILLNNFDKDSAGKDQFPVLHFKKV